MSSIFTRAGWIFISGIGRNLNYVVYGTKYLFSVPISLYFLFTGLALYLKQMKHSEKEEGYEI